MEIRGYKKLDPGVSAGEFLRAVISHVVHSGLGGCDLKASVGGRIVDFSVTLNAINGEAVPRKQIDGLLTSSPLNAVLNDMSARGKTSMEFEATTLGGDRTRYRIELVSVNGLTPEQFSAQVLERRTLN